MVVEATPAAAATLTVSPNTGLSDAQAVTVTGTGWAPNSLIGVCEAVPTVPLDVSNCAGGPAGIVVSSGGAFSYGAGVSRVIDVPAHGGLLDCADPATPCVLAVAVASDIPGTVQTVPLAFAPPGPTVPCAPRRPGSRGRPQRP